MNLRKPARLRPGDVIGLVAPASPVPDPQRIAAGVRYLEGLGYRVELGRSVEARHGFFAGTDAQRAADLNAQFRDRRIKAIFALRGGYGTPRLLPLIDYAAIRREPKILVGFSDLTALQLALLRRSGLVTFSGPLAAVEFARQPDPYTEENFWRLLTSPRRIGPLPISADGNPATLRRGAAQGTLVAGNLAMLASLLGTPYVPQLAGAILVLEDVHEHLHRLDRMLTQLRNAGVLSGLAGLAFGQFTDCTPSRPGDPHLTLPEILAEAARWVKGPVMSGLPYGHQARKLTMPIGLPARLNAARSSLHFADAAVV